jgi:hypothetical protein
MHFAFGFFVCSPEISREIENHYQITMDRYMRKLMRIKTEKERGKGKGRVGVREREREIERKRGVDRVKRIKRAKNLYAFLKPLCATLLLLGSLWL